nr:hypothetical protein [Burkholderia gladioli]
MKLDGAHLDRAEQRLQAVDHYDRLACILFPERGDTRDGQLRGILLEEQLPGNAVGRTHEGDGPVARRWGSSQGEISA